MLPAWPRPSRATTSPLIKRRVEWVDLLGHILLGRIPKCFHFILLFFFIFIFFSVFLLKMCYLVDGIIPLQEPHFALSGERAELSERGAVGSDFSSGWPWARCLLSLGLPVP